MQDVDEMIAENLKTLPRSCRSPGKGYLVRPSNNVNNVQASPAGKE